MLAVVEGHYLLLVRCAESIEGRTHVVILGLAEKGMWSQKVGMLVVKPRSCTRIRGWCAKNESADMPTILPRFAIWAPSAY